MTYCLAALFCSVALASAADSSLPAQREYKPETSSGTHVRFGGLMLAGGYSYGFEPYFWGGPFYPYFSPFYFHPGYFGGYRHAPELGEVRLNTPSKLGEVYLDGAYAGDLAHRKSMWLEPGKYELQVKTPDGTFSQRVYVLSGRTLKLKVTAADRSRS